MNMLMTVPFITTVLMAMTDWLGRSWPDHPTAWAACGLNSHAGWRGWMQGSVYLMYVMLDMFNHILYEHGEMECNGWGAYACARVGWKPMGWAGRGLTSRLVGPLVA